MSTTIINQLQELQKQSYKHLNPVTKSLIQNNSRPRALVDPVLVSNGKYAVKPIKGVSSLTTANNRQSMRKVKTFSVGHEQIINQLNKELLCGENYPILTTALGIAAGVVSAGGSLLFTLATTGLALANTTSKVLARPGDEIWHIIAVP